MIKDINLAFGQQVIFDHVSCNFDKESRIGLVGRNGSGKSTLLKVMAKKQNFDDGVVSIEKGATIGYMPQDVVLQSSKSIYDEAFSALGKISSLKQELEQLDSKLQNIDEKNVNSKVVERYADVQYQLSECNVSQVEIEIKKILVGLGFKQTQFDQTVDSLSVGWKMRLLLAKLLLQKADFYLFDEPTNHLDIIAKDWFLNFIKNSNFGFILVCHDRYFLDHLCTKIFELEQGTGTLYHVNYTEYLIQKEERLRILENAYLRQQKEIAKKTKTIERFRVSATKAKMAQSMLKSLEKIDRIELKSGPKTTKFTFPPAQRSGRFVLKVKDISYSFGNKNIFKNVSFEVERGERVAIVAANGVGKTTLFNIVTGRYDLQVGTVSFGHNVTYELFEQDQDTILNKENTVLNEVEAACKDSETRSLVRKFLGMFLFSGDSVDKKIKVLSGGEKNRVAMVKVLLQKANCLLLDEPTNHLDIQSKEVLLKALEQFSGTILFVSHDRDFLDNLATRILELGPNGIISYPGNYESYIYHKAKERQNSQDCEAQLKVVDKKNISKKSKLSNKEQYELRKKINRVEKKIEKLEEEINQLNVKFEQLKYGTDLYFQVHERLQVCQKKLDESVAEWDQLQNFLC